MGLFGRLFGSKEPATHAPPSEDVKQAIVMLAMTGDFDGLAKSLRSKNPYIRGFTTEGVVMASQARSLGGGQFQISDSNKVDPRAYQLLIPLLDDPDDQVQTAAARNLEKLVERSKFSSDAAQESAKRALAAHRERKKP